jgi:uncharacterized SAM-binding protein YcdF (DUF218 family)
MVLFVLKKIASRLLFPLPLGLLAILAGLALLWGKRRPRLGRALVTLGLAWLLILSTEVVGTALIRPLEGRYEPFGPAQQAALGGQTVDDIVVFAGCVVSLPEYPITRQVGGAPLERLVEGMRLHRLYPSSRLILSGGNGCDPEAPQETLTNVRFAIEMGVPAEAIVVERESKDTDDQARLLAPLLAGRRFIVVTSASHMPRTMTLFRQVGLEPVPAPTEFHTGLYGIFQRESFGAESLFPNSGSLEKSEIAFYEALGTLWTRLTGGI